MKTSGVRDNLPVSARPPWIGMGLLLGVALVVVFSCNLPPESAEDRYLPLLAMGLVIYLLRPVCWNETAQPLSRSHLVMATGLFVAGALTGFLVLQAAGWVMAFRAWAAGRIQSAALPPKRISWVFFFMFPWVAHDFPQVGWWFRMSGAWTSEVVFQFLGFPVERSGTSLLIGGLPMHVAPSCAGLGLLQTLLTAGTLLVILSYPRSKFFYLLLPMIPVMAWLSNVLRIVIITAVALSEGAEFATGAFHTWGGLLVLALMSALCFAGLGLLRRFVPDLPHSTVHPR